ALRRNNAGEQAQKGGFAAAGWTDQEQPLALLQVEAINRERKRVPARPGERHVLHLNDGPGGRRVLLRVGHGGFKCDHMISARSRLGLSRFTSKLFCPLGVMTEMSSSWAPAKALKYSKVMDVRREGDEQVKVYSAWNSE